MPIQLGATGITFHDNTVQTTAAVAGGFSNMQVFASPGTFTTPATTTKIKVTVTGGGGGGGGAGFDPGRVGGSGAGGGTAIYVGPVTASTPYSVTVGSGGGGGNGGPFPTPSGGTGGTSSFGSLASATGGGGGQGQQGPVSGSGATGGTGTAGTLQMEGGDTLPGIAMGQNVFGGGTFWAGYTRGSSKAYGGGGIGGSAPNGPGTNGAAGVVVVEW